jgi:RecA-family ATPase
MEENSSTEIGIFVSACDSIKQMFDCAVLAIHHSGKDASRGMRGSNALLGAVDTSLMLKKSGDNIVLNTEKQKDAEPIDDMAFALEQVALIGETSAVVKRVEKKVEQKKSQGRQRLNENEQIAYDLLIDLLNKSGEDFVYHNVWCDEHISRYPDLSDKVRSDARSKVKKKGYIINEKGKVYLINDLSTNLTEEDLF